MNFSLLPHTSDLQNQGITSNSRNINIISQFLLQICSILFQSTIPLLLHIPNDLFVASSYWWPPKPRHYFKHREHQHYFTISLADLLDFVSIHNFATIVIYHMNFFVPSSYWWPSKPRHYFKHREHQHYFTISLADLLDFVSIHNFATIVIYHMNFFVPSSYWWPSKPRHYFKHREHQHYFTISLADLLDFVSFHNFATIVIYHINFSWLPHTGDLQNQGITSNTGNINIFSKFILQIC